MDSDPDAELQSLLARLRGRFAVEAPHLAGQLRRCARAADDPQAAKDLHAIAHRLAGTAGLFGFPSVGEAAAALDTLLIDAPGDPAASQLAEALASQLESLPP